MLSIWKSYTKLIRPTQDCIRGIEETKGPKQTKIKRSSCGLSHSDIKPSVIPRTMSCFSLLV